VVAAVAGARRFCAARSGVEQDIGAGIISLTSAVGSGVSLVPAFGGAAFWGPVGLGIAAASVVGNVLYQGLTRTLLQNAGGNKKPPARRPRVSS
jgi:hypothetical protein